MPEIVVILIFLIVLSLPVVIAIAVVAFLSWRRKSQPPPQGLAGVQARLSTLEDLRSRKLVTEAEYEERRTQILSEI